MQREEQTDERAISRRKVFALFGSAVAGGTFACVEAAPAAGTGPCTQCSCMGFIGAGSYPLVCQRCGHAWSAHT